MWRDDVTSISKKVIIEHTQGASMLPLGRRNCVLKYREATAHSTSLDGVTEPRNQEVDGLNTYTHARRLPCTHYADLRLCAYVA